jgi:PAS domain S-box-containing protein
MRRHLLLLVLVVLLPTLGLLTYTHVHRFGLAVANERENDLELARAVRMAFEGFTRDIGREELAAGQGLIALRPHTTEQAGRFLEKCRSEYAVVTAFHWVNLDGRIEASSRPEAVGTLIEDSPFFEGVRRSKTAVISPLMTSRITGELIFVVARGLRDDDDRLLGYVAAAVNPDALGILSMDFEPLGQGCCEVYDREGRLAFRLPRVPLTEELRRGNSGSPLLVQALAGQEASGTQTSAMDGQKTIQAYVPLAESGWVVGAGRPYRDVLQPLVLRLLQDLAVMAGIAAVSLTIAWRLSRRIRRAAGILQAFFAHALTPFVILDARFNFVRVNEAYARACRKEVGDFPGHNHFEFYPHAENQAIFEEVVRTRRPHVATAKPFEFPDHPEWGVTYWDWTLVPLLDERGEVERLAFSLQDVTRRQQAEVTRETAAHYARSLIEASLDPLVTISPEGKVTDVNRATEEATGLPRDRLIGTDFSDYFTEPEKAQAGYRQVLAEGLVRDYPLTLRHTSGRRTDVLYNATVYRNESGRVQGVFAAARDVTERRRAERRIEVTRALLELFAHATSRRQYLGAVVEVLRQWTDCRCVGLRVLDNRHRVPYEAYVGFSEPFWEKENWLSVEHDDCLCLRVIKGTLGPAEAALMTPGGSLRCDNAPAMVAGLPPAEHPRLRGECIRAGFKTLALVPLRYRGRILGALHLADEREGVATPERVEMLEAMAPLIGEALDRFNAEEALREQAVLLDLAHDAILVRSPDDRITFWSQGAEQTYGWTREEALGRTPHELLQTQFPLPLAELLDTVRRKGHWEGQLIHRRRDGTRLVVDSRWALQEGKEGEPPGILEINRNVTERRKAEEELERHRAHLEELVRQRTGELTAANEELGRSNRDLEQFAYVASHDLQEPLRIVAGYLQLLERRYKARLDADADEFIRFAVDGAARMQNLIVDLLAYSRVGTQERRSAPTPCGAVVEQALANLRRSIEETGAKVTVDPLPTVAGDAAQLVQLFQNLIGNALKFRSDRPPEIHVGAEPQDGAWRFFVRDNGLGIEPQYAERIFVIFQRLHTREKYPGTGIGLAICKRIVERHGGRLWMESKPGLGSTFYFTLA